MSYNPKTGVNAGKRNFNAVKTYLEENPGTTGVQAAKELNLSLVTVYKHLKKLQNENKQ